MAINSQAQQPAVSRNAQKSVRRRQAAQKTRRQAGFWRRSLLSVILFGLAGLVYAQIAGPVNLQGTGGTITAPVAGPANGYIVHTFTANGTFVPPPGVTSVDVLVVAGGGGGGRGGASTGGGGGAGGFVQSNAVVVAGAVNVTVGGGGAGGTGAAGVATKGTNGSNSAFGALVSATGGGGGGAGNIDNGPQRAGNPGGSGGGGGAGNQNNTENGAGGAGTALQGNNGGNGRGRGAVNDRAGGGGGGAGAVGVTATTNGNGGAGGSGTASALFGDTFAGGGGGGANNPGAAGSGGGGVGLVSIANAAANGTANTGGGGGGSRDVNAGNGGSGIVIVRYLPSTLRIGAGQQPGAQTYTGIALPTQPSVTLLTSAGAPVSGETVTASLDSGTAVLGGTLTAVTNASGIATFTNLTLTGATNSVNTIRMAVAGNAATNFVVTNQITIITPSFFASISHPVAGGGACAPTAITISVHNDFNQLVTNFTGAITVTSTPGTGNWSNTFAAPGAFDNGTLNDGIATYTFTVANAGVVQLGYTSAAGGYTFNVTGATISGVTNNGGTLTLTACEFRIFHSGANGNVCRIEEVTIRVTTTAGTLMTGYTGTMNLSTTGTLASSGTWSKTAVPADALGTLTPVPSLGSASYVFVAGDAGEIKLNYANNQAGTANFNIVAANVAQPSGGFDPDLVLSSCLFRITHSNASDLCSIEQITIRLVDSVGVTVTNYTGTINLSTTTGFGSWQTVNLSTGLLTDPVNEDGNATYKFELGDAGVVTLGFRLESVTGPVNINISDGVTLDARDPNNNFDRNIVIALCTFEISHGQNSNACSITEVTFRVRNSEGGIATDYRGTMRLTTNTTRGDWIVTTSPQVRLTAPSGADVGLADYAFAASDAGQVTLRYYSTTPAVINFDADDGLITENGAFDPDLFYSGCFPNASLPNCTNPGTSTTISIPAQNAVPELRSRMVLMATMQIGNSNTNTTAQFNGQNMTRIVRMENDDQSPIVTTEIWAIFDTNLPAAAGSYSGVFSGGVGQPAICLLSVTGVAQTAPQIAAIPEQGPVNSSKYTGPVVSGRHNARTSITTSVNNSFVFSVVANDRGSNSSLDAYFYRPPQPATTLTGIWGGRVPGVQNDPPYRAATTQANANLAVPVDGSSGTKTAGSAGVLSSAGLLEVVEPFQSGAVNPPTINAHVVAAFRPLVAGAPLAESYVPVILYETFSGSLSYRAIGNSLRTQPSTTALTVDPVVDCAMVNFATGTTATLTLPTNASIEAAYLYWGGSGETADIVSQVNFGLDGNEVAVVAEQVFQAVGVTSSDVDFFAGYANVTGIVTGSGLYRLKDLVVQTTAPWTSNGTCAGGWSLVAIYSDDDEHLRVVNLFHGFQPFQFSAFTLVPRNFRMATFDNARLLPNGQITHVTLEGDEQLANGEETLGMQRGPTGQDATIFDPLITSFNPANAEFNSTITRPMYWLAPSGFIEFDATAGINNDGYEIDFPGPDAVEAGRTGNRIGSTWGFDVDTHYLSHTLLQPFAQPDFEAELITTRYSAGQDLVVLLSEVISIANFPIADVEVFISESGTFKVNGTGTYTVTVTNNGNGTNVAGAATGVITVAQQLPTGMTFANFADVSGTGWTCTVVLNPGAYTCTYNISVSNPNGELVNAASLPPLTVNVQVGSATVFPLQSNTAKATVRMLHSGGSCPAVTPGTTGFIPDPDTCVRAPQFDNVNDTQGGTIDIDSLFDKSVSNNNVASVLTTVTGVTTDLRMQKSVIGSLETDQAGQYLLTVTNLGPDISNAPFTITDLQPVGVDFLSATGTNWTCNTISPTLSCVYNANLLTPLAVNASTSLTLNVDVTGGAGFNITNTAQVTVGTGNFDLVPSNNAATDITTIVGPPVASQERFLLSVSTPLNSTSIGGLNNFTNDDLIIYDPSTNIATMFFDDSEVNDDRIDDINAVHLLKNGHIIMSANGNSTIGSNNLVFDPWDLVRYDPILDTATVFLDGEAVFGANYQDVNINGVYVMDDCAANNNSLNCSIVFTTTSGGQMPAVGGGTLTFTASDLVRYYRTGPNAGLAEIYLDGSDADVFGTTEGNGNTNIDAFYLRVDPANPNAVLDVFVLSVDNVTGIIGAGLDPITGTLFTRDDVTELDRVNDTTENLFVGDVELGVFEPSAAERRLDALHLVEDGFVGHFSIRQEQGGSVCEAGVLRISKHDGLTHNRDLDYYGSVRINASATPTSSSFGTWQLQTGSGVLTNNGNGEAIYTYASSDQGTVVLRLVYNQIGTINVGVTNGLVRELPSEDPNFSYDPELTLITWADEFGNVGFGNNDGSRNWAGNWTEVDGIDGTLGGGLGAGTGNVQIVNGRLSMTSSSLAASNNIDPSLTRVFDLDAVPFSEDVVLSARYGHSALALSDSFVIEARGSNTAAWVVLQNFTNITADQTNSSIPVSYNLSTILAAQNPVQSFSSTSQVRFRVNNGYELNRFFFIDDIKIETATDQCGFGGSGGVDHYAIAHSGFGISCVGTPITFTAHDSNHDGIDAEGETITLSTSPAKGVWSRVLSGNGTLSTIASQSADNGQATYTFAAGEQTVQLLLNYTVPAGALQPININVLGSVSGAVEIEDPQLEIAESGLLFYNETLLNTTIPTQIAGKPSGTNPLGHLLTIQGVRSSDNDPMQCTPLFAPGQTLRVELAAECLDPALCIGGETMTINGDAVTLANDNSAAGINGTFTEVNLNFITQPSGDIGATILLNYSDVGLMQLHARYNIPFGFFGTPSPDNTLTAPAYSGDFMIGSSNNFVVRPFGFEIDFPGAIGLDRRSNFPVGNFLAVNSQPSTSFAADSSGSPWRIAGAGFDTRVTAMGWQAADDTDFDGQPDLNANLHDNRVTPNFYNDTDGVANDYRVRLTVLSNQAQSNCIVGAAPECGVLGVLTNDTLLKAQFNSPGSGLINMNYNEVGIIDMQAQLVDSAQTATTYQGTEVIIGRVRNVGRFYPQRFEPSATSLLPRVTASCTPPSTFTYMDEPFGIAATLTARNLQGHTTVNYRGGFAKLDLYNELNLRAIEVVNPGDNTNRSSRLLNTASPNGIPTDLQPRWSAVNGGVLLVSGNLIYARATPADPDGPFEGLVLAFYPTDNDGVTLDSLVLNAEITENLAEFFEIALHNFRYGRIQVDNAYGPETEPLDITFSVEYFDGVRFVTNTIDNCSVLASNELDLLSGTYTGSLNDPETSIVSSLTSRFNGGLIQGTQAATNPTDLTFRATAPGDGNAGTVDIELDLSPSGLNLPWLQFRWPHDDQDFNENPRATLEFGQFRSHDRVINWQEIYNGVTP